MSQVGFVFWIFNILLGMRMFPIKFIIRNVDSKNICRQLFDKNGQSNLIRFVNF